MSPAGPVTLVAPIRWAREFGWIEIWDAEARGWQTVPADAVPRWWRQAAQEAKQRTAFTADEKGA